MFRVALRLPLGQTAIQHRDILVPEEPEHPPDARSRLQTQRVIDNNLMTVSDTHGPHAGHEFLDRRHHVRQVRAMVRNIVDIKETRPGDVPSIILGFAIASGFAEL